MQTFIIAVHLFGSHQGRGVFIDSLLPTQRSCSQKTELGSNHIIVLLREKASSCYFSGKKRHRVTFQAKTSSCHFSGKNVIMPIFMENVMSLFREKRHHVTSHGKCHHVTFQGKTSLCHFLGKNVIILLFREKRHYVTFQGKTSLCHFLGKNVIMSIFREKRHYVNF